jgi:ubiquinone/menaquinone biosynthesis C-methylase UbiE
MSFDYNNCVWGKKIASLSTSDSSAIRLKRILKAISKLPQNSRVLEVGCGAGSFIRAIGEIRPDLNCFGCDISEKAIIQAKSMSKKIDFQICNNALPYNENGFDAIFIIDVLEHVYEPEKLLKEIYRLLKRGGIFFSFVPCENDRTALWKYLDKLGVKKNITQKFAGHVNFFAKKELLNLYDKINFKIVKISYSEHLFGQILGVVSFLAMRRFANKKSLEQINNEMFFDAIKSKKFGWINFIRVFANNLIYLESYLFFWLPSPNIFITAIK